MKIFVSYARADNDASKLRAIEQVLTACGRPYLDDLHFSEGADRKAALFDQLDSADIFLVVMTPAYLRTEWTRQEFRHAIEFNKRIGILEERGEIRFPTEGELVKMREIADRAP